MKNKSKKIISQVDGIAIPGIASTRNGLVFCPVDSRWAYRDGGLDFDLDFSSIKYVSDEFLARFKIALLWYVENKSPTHARNIFWHMKRFIEYISNTKIITEINDFDILNYRSHLGERRQWYLSSFSSFLKKWNELGLGGISKDAIELLSKISIKGNKKGEAVRTMDPDLGPFTNIERDALFSELNNSYAKKKINTSDYLLCVLTSILGQRPVQYSYLKVCDLKIEKRDDDSLIYILRMPRAKQRDRLPRSEFKERVLIPQIGELLDRYVKRIMKQFVGRLQDPKQAPMFPDVRVRVEYVKGFEFHSTSSLLSKRIRIAYEKLNVFSERTGNVMHVIPVRFRRTIGTQAAVEGHGPLVIAELLDHTDLQNIDVYVSATPEIIERIDRAVAIKLAPLAQAFAGVLVDSKTEQDVPQRLRIVAPQQSLRFDPVGSCGQHGFCGFAAPVACYTCSNFRAWLDGPHEEILEYLVAERDRLMGIDVRIASVNDRTILAVAQVVEMCKNEQVEQDLDV